MASVVRLLTFVEFSDSGSYRRPLQTRLTSVLLALRHKSQTPAPLPHRRRRRNDDGPDARRMSVSARHEAVLDDGRRVVLLDDRGWGGPPARLEGHETVENMVRTARVVVGPDEPGPGWTHAQMAAAHWDSLAAKLQQQGIEIDGTELRRLPHEVELSDRVLARITPEQRVS